MALLTSLDLRINLIGAAGAALLPRFARIFPLRRGTTLAGPVADSRQ
jgi:hypothetical protein